MTATGVAHSPLLPRLKRIEGQVRGIARMVNDDRDCIDILTQLSAADQALRSVAVALLDEHVARCLVAQLTPANRIETPSFARPMTLLSAWSVIDRPAMEGKRRDLHTTNRPAVPTPV